MSKNRIVLATLLFGPRSAGELASVFSAMTGKRTTAQLASHQVRNLRKLGYRIEYDRGNQPSGVYTLIRNMPIGR